MSFDAHKNFAYSTVGVAPSPAASGTSLDVAAGEGALFPVPPFNCTIWPTSTSPRASNSEIVRVTGIAGDTLTIDRAQEGSSARTIVVGDQIAQTITAKTITDIEAGSGIVTCPDNATDYRWVPRLSDDGETIVGEWVAV
jgi:hypothetical protein